MSSVLPVPTDKNRQPPGPKGSPLLGSMLDFGRDLNGFLTRCAREYGPITRFRMVHRRAYLLADPAYNEQMLLGNYRNFIKHPLFFERTKKVFGNGLISNDGDSWRKQRRLAAPAFHRERINGYGDIMTQYARELVSEWHDGEIRDVYMDMRTVTAKVVARALFDENIAGDVDQISQAMTDILDGVGDRMLKPVVAPFWFPTPGAVKYRRGIAQINALVSRFIEQHKKGLEQRTTLLAMLMQARDENGQPMEEQQLRDEVVTLFLAGHDTTGTALSWTIQLLMQYPEWQAQAIEEVTRVLGQRAPGTADLPSLPKLGWILRESMRLYPPVSVIARQSVADCEIGGYHIPANSLLYISPSAMHRNPAYYPDPDAFRPERWDKDFESSLPRYAYIPFSGGPRVCIGDRFAMIEGVLLLANFLQFYEFIATGDKPPVPYASITLVPVGGIRAKLKKRDLQATA